MLWQDHRISIAQLRRRLREQPFSCWLSPAEMQRLSEMPWADRRLRWLGGRWLAKQLLRELTDDPKLPLSALHIESRDSRDRSSRPRVLCRGRLQDWQLTISHSAQSVYVAASLDPQLRLGADIVDLQGLDDRFTRFWFSQGEQAWCQDAGNTPAVCVIWSLKESWYKAVGGDQPFAPRLIDVTEVTSIDKLSALQFSRTERGEFAVDKKPATIVCRRFPNEIATLVLHRGRQSRRVVAQPRLPLLPSRSASVRKDHL